MCYCSSKYYSSLLFIMGTVAKDENECALLGEVFSIACIMEAHFETIIGKKLNIEEKINIILSWPREEAPPVIKGSLDANEDISVVEKKLNIEEKIDIGLSWPSEEAPLVIKGSLDANEHIGVVEVSSVIDDVFDIGESNVENMKVRSEFSEF
ncbi:hypothetical protein Tco_1087214 [Tanacetum coccineum]